MGQNKISDSVQLVVANLVSIDHLALSFAAEVLSAAKIFVLTGVGTSSFAAMKLSHLLNCYGIEAQYRDVLELAHGQLGALRSADKLCALSLSGETKEILPIFKTCGVLGVKRILLSGNASSELARLSDKCFELRWALNTDPDHGVAVNSSLIISAFISCVCLHISNLKPLQSHTLLLNHPSGNVGTVLKERLQGK